MKIRHCSIAEPAPNSENHLRIRLSVASSVDAFQGSSEDNQNRILVELLDAPFFAGMHISALL